MTANENNNANNLLLLAIVLGLLGAIFLTSCGSRKVTKSGTKEQEQKTEKITIETETRVTDNTKIIDTSTTDEIDIDPNGNDIYPDYVIGSQEIESNSRFVCYIFLKVYSETAAISII